MLTPAGTPDARLAIAASRAGAVGVLDLEFSRERSKALRAMEALGHHAGESFGVMVNVSNLELLNDLLRASPEGFGTVVLTNPARLPCGDAVKASKEAGKRVLFVVTSAEAAVEAAGQDVDGLIVKGNEAGGWVGEETAFVLLQAVLPAVSLPVYVQGGIGLHTAAACFAAGAAGVVLDNQLLLTRESPLKARARMRVETMDGSETQVVGASLGAAFRAYARGDSAMTDILARMEAAEAIAHDDIEQARRSWRAALDNTVDWEHEGALWPAGQDASFAAEFAKSFVTVAGVLSGMRASVAEHQLLAKRQCALAPDAPLARSHLTRYPVVQGPMTRVSDRPAFAAAVAGAGGLPFLALALMRAEDIRPMLAETATLLEGRSWGVGILGFVPPELREEQLAEVRAAKPPFVLIAGGQPNQAAALEAEGITTYLHVPSPGLLEIYLKEGARRFVFEGRECGGHVGPRTSFVLWEKMIDVLLSFLDGHRGAEDLHVLFAGGIHDALSAQMVATMAATLVEAGVKIGVLVGTAYLFTEEAVTTGAIKPSFQKAALDCRETVILSATPGYATRCLPSPFCDTFEAERRRLILEGTPLEVMKQNLEELNIGRLRVASKGVDRNPLYGSEAGAPRLLAVDPDDQWRQGMYMIGQVASLRDRTVTVAELHRDISEGSAALLRGMLEPVVVSELSSPRTDIAIVGMSSILPGSSNLHEYWSNILAKVDSVREVPPERWDWREYYDPDPNAEDKVYSRWGGFIDEVPFDPLLWGMPPSSLPSIEPFQLLSLELVRAAIEDAGYSRRPFNRDRTSVILGAGGGAPDLTAGYVVRSSLAGLFGSETSGQLVERLNGTLPRWTEDSFPGLLMNVAAGRVANRFDFGGINLTVDAACASSLAAVYLGIRDLQARTSDVVIVGGAEGIQNPFDFLCFAKTHALSPTGRSRPFDADADGIAISEGFAAVFLKRLEDAERDGDRIYAVIRGAGASSDGRDKGLTAPRPEGQMRAFRRAYQEAGFSPATVGLFEAHGTGTVAGDQAEISSLTALLGEAGAKPASAAIGSVKSMIGHTKATAGVAGLVKTAKALYHRVLPPTLGVANPNEKLRQDGCPLYVNTEPRPWIQAPDTDPRRAAVSAFGFGGTNFHVVLEEYAGDYLEVREPALTSWPEELFLWRSSSKEQIGAALEQLATRLEQGARPHFPDLAYTLGVLAQDGPAGGPSLAVTAGSLEQLQQRLHEARSLVAGEHVRAHQPHGLHYSVRPLLDDGKLAFVFPGQGSQFVNAARELAMMFPEARAALDEADEHLGNTLGRPLSSYIYPPPSFSVEEEGVHASELTRTEIAQPALGAIEVALMRTLTALGVKPEMTAGHSYGELVALHAAGSFDYKTLLTLSGARGRFMAEAAEGHDGAMAAVMAPADALAPIVEGSEVTIANLNSPAQTVISGPAGAIDRAVSRCRAEGLRVKMLPVATAFHSSLVSSAGDKLRRLLRKVDLQSPSLPVFSNTTGKRHSRNVRRLSELLAAQLARPVRFSDEIEAMYAEGARVFLEVGPRNVLTGLVRQVLGDRPHLAIPVDAPGRPGLSSLLDAGAALFAEGHTVNVERLFQGRSVRRLDLGRLALENGRPQLSPTTWMVSGAGVRPAGRPLDRAQLPLSISVGHGNGTVPQPKLPASASAKASPAGRPGFTPSLPEQRAPEPAPRPARPVDDAAGVIDHFQRVMQQFLSLQERVMLAGLGSLPGNDASPAARAPGEAAGQPAEPVASEPRHEPPTPERTDPPSPPTDAKTPSPGLRHPVQPTGVDIERVRGELLAIVSERTGYPAEALNLDANLEADLGVDSIKRVEIAGAAKRFVEAQGGRPVDFEQLTGATTLAGMLELLTGAGTPCRPEAREQPAGRDAATPQGVRGAGVNRFEVVATTAAPPQSEAGLDREGVIAILDDAGGLVATELSACLIAGGWRIWRLHSGAPTEPALEELNRRGKVAALIDLTGLAGGRAGELEPFFSVAKSLAATLQDSAGKGGAALLSAARLDGSLGITGKFEDPTPAWRAGFVKSIGREWRDVRSRFVDVGREAPAGAARRIAAELFAADDFAEVGYREDGGRVTCVLTPAPVHPRGPILDPEAVVLITGGARGITAECALALGQSARCRLVLVGRTPFPSGPEPGPTAGLTGERPLKRAIFEQMLASGDSPKPAEIQLRYSALLREREVRTIAERFRAAGASFTYLQCDVRDPEAFGALLDRVYAWFGRIDGVIHGAGVIEDRLLADKTPESFRRVFDTKVSAALVLESKLRLDGLKFVVFFSSVAGRFGNRGQADYAAANEVLNKLAHRMNGRWPGRAVAINWGPWATTGMVTEEAERQFAAQGVGRIPLEAGISGLLDEIAAPAGPAEVVIADLGQAPPVRIHFAGTAAGPEEPVETGAWPLLAGTKAERTTSGVSLRRTFNPAIDLYLPDHILDGKPVVPFAVGMELMAEAAQFARPHLRLVELCDIRMLNGIVVHSEPSEVTVEVAPLSAANGDGLQRVKVTIGAAHTGRLHYSCTAVLWRPGPSSEFPPELVNGHFSPLTSGAPLPWDMRRVYDEWLFHGPLLEAIETVDRIEPSGASGRLRTSSPVECLSGTPAGSWLVDPVLVDAAFQMQVVWTRKHWDMTILPSSVASWRPALDVNPPGGKVDGVLCELRIRPESAQPISHTDFALYAPDGRLLAMITDLQATGSRALNRLSLRRGT